MNNKGQSIFLGIIIGVYIFFIGVMILNIIIPTVTISRNTTNLDCADSTISDGSKLTCLIVDLVVPYFIILILSMAGGLIFVRLL